MRERTSSPASDHVPSWRRIVWFTSRRRRFPAWAGARAATRAGLGALLLATTAVAWLGAEAGQNPDAVEADEQVGVAANQPPVANAGPDAVGVVAKALTLNGTGSVDPEGARLTYQWTVMSAPAGSRGLLLNPAKAKPKLVIDRAGTYVVQLIVRDGQLSSAPDQVEIVTANTIPVANAGPDRVVPLGAAAQLDAGASTDLDGDPITYSWKLKKPKGSQATLSEPSSVRPTFVPDINGNYVATVTVSDGARTKTDSVTFTTINNLAPVARAGRDHPALLAGQKILLDGAESTDANGDRLTYAWSIVKRPSASTAVLATPNAPRTAFTADVKGNYTFLLTVTDPLGAISTDQVLYSVAPPDANAGPDQSVPAGSTVTLDGSNASHLKGVIWFGWSFLSTPAGSAATLSDPIDPQPQFVADLPGYYVAQLTVFDGTLLRADTVVVSVGENLLPRIAFGPDRVVPPSTTVTLDSSVVTDPDPGALSFRWALLARPAASAASLTAATGATTQLPVDVAGVYVVQLITTDQDGGTTTGTVVVTTAKGRPVVSAGPDREAAIGVALPLPAAATDPDGTSVSYAWSLLLQPDDAHAGLANATTATATFTPDLDGVYLLQVIATDPDGLEAIDTVVVRTGISETPVVTIAATDAAASETGSDPGTFTFTRSGNVSQALTGVQFTRGGSATSGTDYSPALPASGTVDFAAGEATATITITPTVDGATEGSETVVLTLVDGPAYELGAPATRTATVTIADANVIDNGTAREGTISSAGEIDSHTFSATVGSRIAVHLGEVTDITGDFTPWARLRAPSGAIVANNWGAAATRLEVVAAETGVYTVLVASADSGTDGRGTYRLEFLRTPPPYSVAPGDDGGVLTNGGVHTGQIVRGDVDVWTVQLTAGQRFAIHLSETTDTSGDFTPWVRLWAPSGADETNWGAAATRLEVVAAETGTYTVLVASNDSGTDGTGQYRLETAHTPAPYVVSPGDHGGALTNGSFHIGDIVRGDVDVWTVNMVAGQRLAVHLGEVTDTSGDFTPWLRLWAPSGASATDWGAAATRLDVVAAETGVYTVLVASNDSGTDGTGQYRLETVRTAGPYTISPGDQGGALTNGSFHTGEVVRGDVDTWTVNVVAGQRLTLHLGEITDTSADFTPWLRLFAPSGASVTNWGAAATRLDVAAAETGVYTVVVASNDSGMDGTGQYRLELAKGPGPYTTSAGDEGAALVNGAIHTGTVVRGDVDTWTVTLTAGQRIAVHLGEVTDTSGDFTPWLRVWAPSGTDATNWGAAATRLEVVAAETGVYTVLVASNDSGMDGTGQYRLEVDYSPGPFPPSAGDHGGSVSLGVPVAGQIVRGDVDGWTVSAVAGQTLRVTITETADGSGDFTPWIRVWSALGASLGSNWGATTATLNIPISATGTYNVIVASNDSGTDGSGNYQLSVTVVP